MTSHAARLPGLDALRALATVAVVACRVNHARPPLSPPVGDALSLLAQLGFNAFFTLPGFLVGGIAPREIHTPAAVVVPVSGSVTAIQQRARSEGEAIGAFIRRRGIKVE